MNVCILSGSPQKNSNTLRVAKAVSHLIGETGHIPKIVDFANYDLLSVALGENDLHADTPFRTMLRESMSEASLIIVLSPEYNWMPSVEIIQMINEYGGRSFSNMWNQKVFAFAGCSSGRGGRLPAIHLTQIVGKILNFLEFDSFIAPKIFESQFTSQVLDEEGQSKGNFDYDHGLKQFVLSAVKFGKRWQEA